MSKDCKTWIVIIVLEDQTGEEIRRDIWGETGKKSEAEKKVMERFTEELIPTKERTLRILGSYDSEGYPQNYFDDESVD